MISTFKMSARLVPLVAAAVVSIGCTGDPVAGRPLSTIGSSSTQTTPGTSTTSGSPTGDLPTSTGVVILYRYQQSTIAGAIGTWLIRVDTGGSVIRTAADGVTSESLRISPDDVRTLIAQAQTLGLLDSPDFGDVQVTDVGDAELKFTVDGRQISLSVHAPGMHDIGTAAQQQARAAFDTFTDRLSSLDGIRIVDGPTPVAPKSVTLSARPIDVADLGSSDGEDRRWPLKTRAPQLFRAADCLMLSGAEATALLDLVRNEANGKPIERHDGMALIDVASGERGPTVLTLRIGVDSRSCLKPQAPQVVPRVLPFSAEQRRPAGVWERWMADHALQQAAGRGALPIGDPGYLDDYEFGYVAGTVAGKAVIDVVAIPDADHAGRSDIPRLVVRVDPNTAAGPTVSKVTAG